MTPSPGLKGLKSIRDFDLSDKVVFLRLDLNVPIENGKITDTTRIRESLPTIRFALEKGAHLVMASHLGRPKSADDKQFSLEPVAKELSSQLGIEVILFDEPKSDAIRPLIKSLKKNQAILLENLRFEPGETKNSVEFAQGIAAYSDIYINDAFGACHRAHATIAALPELMKVKGIGFLIEKEITWLDKLMHSPQSPYLAIMGGSKVSDKIGVIEKMMDVVDGFIIGGAMAYTFLKAQGKTVGKSLVEGEKINYARELLARCEARNKSVLLPVDHLITQDITKGPGQVTKDANIPEGFAGVDIGPQTIKNFTTAISKSATVFWNGPMGIFENPDFSKGTFAVAKALAENPGTKIVGGGDSAAAAEASGYAAQMTHISTGGGASLEYLQGDRLPGLEVLRERQR
jgi:phosphoglycerate kinase